MTGKIKRQEGSVGYGGLYGLVDPNGVLYSAGAGSAGRNMLRWDTALPLSGPRGVNWTVEGDSSFKPFASCIDSQGNVWVTSVGTYAIRKYAPDGTLLGSFSHGYRYAAGCAVDGNDHVWVAHHWIPHSTPPSHVGHLLNDGTFIGNVYVGPGGTSGLSVDAAGKVWALRYYDRRVSRIDPSAGPIGADGVTPKGQMDLQTAYLRGDLRNGSDMTGSALFGAPDTGTWFVVYDSGEAWTEWGKVTWTSDEPDDSSITVTAASSTNGVTFGPPENVTHGVDLTVAAGQYLKVTVRFARATEGEEKSPILYDLTIGSANVPPVADAGGTYTGNEGSPISLDGSASYDPNDSIVTYEWDFDNDGMYDDATGVYPYPQLVYDDNGSTQVGLKVTDSYGESNTATADITVNNVAPTASLDHNGPVNEGSDIVLSLSSPYDPSSVDTAAGFEYAFDCSTGYSAYGGASTANCATNDNGTRTVKGKIKDKDGGETEYTASVTVNNVVPVIRGFTAPRQVLVNTVINASAPFTDAGTADTHTAQWDWGDTTCDPVGTVNYEGSGSGSVSGSCTYTKPGSYTVKVTVTDDDGGSRGTFSFLFVYNTPEGSNVVVYPIDSTTGAPAPLWVMFDTVTFYGITTVTSTTTGALPPAGFWLLGTFYEITTSSNLRYSGPIRVCINYTDPSSGNESDLSIWHYKESQWTRLETQFQNFSSNVICADVDSLSLFAIFEQIDFAGPETSNLFATPNPVAINNSVALTATVSDAETGGVTVASAEYNIDQGSSGLMNGSFHEVTVNVSAVTPLFTATGVYDICVRGTDAPGNVGDPVCLLLPVYDPDGGFVTGGGWIMSPPGACQFGACTDDTTGKANFGFVSKYKKGATVPTGNTEFQFRAGNLNFHSSTYQWLVVAGARAQFKGTGTINGSGDYGFLLFAIDGQVNGGGGADKFRIKIWDKNNGDAVVYDNEIGSADDAEPTTFISRGSIMISSAGNN
jgi:hypothetical protein